MVVTIKRRIIRRGGVSPPALETQRFTAKFVNLWLLYLSGGETPPLRTASLIQISPSINSYLSNYPIPPILSKGIIKNAKT